MVEDIVERQIGQIETGAEWGNAQQIFAHFGLRRGTLIKLAERNLIETSTFKHYPESRKTIRLFKISSIRKFLANQSTN